MVDKKFLIEFNLTHAMDLEGMFYLQVNQIKAKNTNT